MRRSILLPIVVVFGFAAGAAAGLALMLVRPLDPAARAGGDAGRTARASYADAVERAASAVVNVYGTGAAVSDLGVPSVAADAAGYRPQSRPRRGLTSLGSGVLISTDGLLVTNGHIVAGATEIKAELPSGRVLDVTLLGVDPETDLAVLRASDADLPSVAVGDSSTLRVGDVVLAIGNPFGIGQTVSLGIVSATDRTYLGLTDIENFIQTDAAINPGNSGGALIDAAGRLVGINTAIMSESGLSEGVGFAIPAELVMQVVRGIADTGSVERGWIGIGGRTMTPQLAARFGLRAPHGVLVTNVEPNTPAERAGLRTGDVVTRAGDQPLHSSHALRTAVTEAGPGATITLQVWRGSAQMEIALMTAERPPGGVTGSGGGTARAALPGSP